MAELIKTWGDGSSLLVNYTGRGDGTITVSGDANSGEARSMELSVRAGSLVRTLTVNQATRPSAYLRLDYLRSDGATVFDTGETNTTYQIMTVLDNLGVSNRYLYYNGPQAAKYTDRGLTVYDSFKLYSMRLFYLADYNRRAVWANGPEGYMYVKTLNEPTDDPNYNDYDSKVKYKSTASISTKSRLMIFGQSLSEPYDQGAELYRVKMSSYTTVIHNWVPCVRTADGIVGLYDLVKGTFLPPAVGSPLAGNVLGDINDFA